MLCTSSSQARSRQVARSVSRKRICANTPPVIVGGYGSVIVVPNTLPASRRCSLANPRNAASEPSSSGMPIQMTSSAVEATRKANSTKPAIRRAMQRPDDAEQRPAAGRWAGGGLGRGGGGCIGHVFILSATASQRSRPRPPIG